MWKSDIRVVSGNSSEDIGRHKCHQDYKNVIHLDTNYRKPKLIQDKIYCRLKVEIMSLEGPCCVECRLAQCFVPWKYTLVHNRSG